MTDRPPDAARHLVTAHETTARPTRIGPAEVVYQDRYQRIDRLVADFDGFSKEYFVSDHGQRAAMLAVRGDEVLLVRQYRLLIDDLSLEVPGGRIEEGEAPHAAALRECLEETGVRCRDARLLIRFQPSLDILKNLTHIYYSTDCEETSDREAERRAWLPLDRCIDMAFRGHIADVLTITALLAYRAVQDPQAERPRLVT